MINIVNSQLQLLVAAYLDHRSLYRFSSCHRSLYDLLSDVRCYIFNTPFRPRYVTQLIDDLNSLNNPNTSNQTISTAFPPHLTSHTARKSYLTQVRYVDLRYCREDLEVVPQIIELLALTQNATDLTITGHWTFAVHDQNDMPDYRENTFPALRHALRQLPLRFVTINGPVWERVVDVISEIRTLYEFHCTPLPENQQPFHSFPCLNSATLSDAAFINNSDQNSEHWFPALRSLRLHDTLFPQQVITGFQKLNLTSLHLYAKTLPVEAVSVLQQLKLTFLCLGLYECDDSWMNLTTLFVAQTPLSQSLMTLDIILNSSELDVFHYVEGLASLTSLAVTFDENAPASPDFVQSMMLLIASTPRLSTLDIDWPRLIDILGDGADFPIELAEQTRLSSVLKCGYWRSHEGIYEPISTTLSMLYSPFFSSLCHLELGFVCAPEWNDDLLSIASLHTVKLCKVSCGASTMSWLKRIAPNVRHLHLGQIQCEGNSLWNLFPDLLSLELHFIRFDAANWLDELACLPLRCLALRNVTSVDDVDHMKWDLTIPAAQWMQRILLDGHSSFTHLQYILWITCWDTYESKVRDVMPLLPDVCAQRPHLQIDLQDLDDALWLLDYEKVVKFCD